eukprot:scaffold132948_cov30-Phaeocystis_antarctica.AAC.1
MRTLTPASALASPPCPQLASHLTSSPHTSPGGAAAAQGAEGRRGREAGGGRGDTAGAVSQAAGAQHIAARQTLALAPYMHRHMH